MTQTVHEYFLEFHNGPLEWAPNLESLHNHYTAYTNKGPYFSAHISKKRVRAQIRGHTWNLRYSLRPPHLKWHLWLDISAGTEGRLEHDSGRLPGSWMMMGVCCCNAAESHALGIAALRVPKYPKLKIKRKGLLHEESQLTFGAYSAFGALGVLLSLAQFYPRGSRVHLPHYAGLRAKRP